MFQSKKFKVVTLGCRTNQYESQAYSDQLRAMGFQEAQSAEEADLCIVNTCTVTQSADSSSRHQIRVLAKEHPRAKIVVTGCLTESAPQMLQAMQEVDLIVPNLKKERLLATLFPTEEIPEFAICHFEAHTRAFVKVQDGCNSFCTYCIIPYVRGRSRSRSAEEIVKEVHQLVANGYKEVVLTGINIGDFDGAPTEKRPPVRLAELIRMVDQIDGLKRLRLSSIDPDEVDGELIDAILKGKTTCPSMHIVLQSGSNVVLKRMNRKYTREVFLDTIERLRQACPDFTFTTDIIVGFPGETVQDFQETLDVMHTVQFAKVHMFPYSVRPRTRAALYPNQVPIEVIEKRKVEVLHLAEQLSFSLRKQFIGKTVEVLIENQEGSPMGHTQHFLPVRLINACVQPNQIVSAEIIENQPDALIGKVLL